MAIKIKKLNRPLDIKEIDEKGRFVGYASVFGEIDYGRDIVMPGAFAKSLKEKARKNRKIPILWQHKEDTPIGVYEDIHEDSNGLFVEGQLTLGVQKADEAFLLAKARAISGISIGYIPVKDRYNESKRARELLEIDLWEASMVTFPMLDTARIDAVKSISELTTIRDVEDYLRDAGLSPSEAKAVISCIKTNCHQRDVEKERSQFYKSLIDQLKD